MTDIAVQHLHLCGPPDRTALAAFRVEDALRTEVREERLVLVRRIHIGQLPGTARPRALPDRLGSVWRSILNGAAHGDSDHAAGANCVWFADAAEAHRLLVRRLARGQKVDAWYWRLAVPDWRGETAEAWVSGQLARGIEQGDGAKVLALVEGLVAAAAVGLLIGALLAVPGGGETSDAWNAAQASAARAAANDRTHAADAGERPAPLLPAETAIGLPAHRVARMIARLPAVLRRVLEQLALRATPARSALRLIGEALILRRWPELRFAPARLKVAIEEFVAQLAEPDRLAAALDAAHLRDALRSARDRTSAPRPVSPLVARYSRALPDSDRSPQAPGTSVGQEAPANRENAEPGGTPSGEQHSRAAGLMLTIIPLIELGWREWLAGHPDLIGTAPGPHLLDYIAAHHRVPADDPVRQLWELDAEDRADWQYLWRAGLDRWLRRRVRVKLHGLVWRPGWVMRDEDAVRVRFPLASADIRLRRHALDRDPGWVDWLGVSVRYTYRDTPGHR
jgi:hypothetical protein